MSDLAPTTKSRLTSEHRLALAAFTSVTALIIVFLLRDASAFVTSTQDELIGHLGASAGFTIAASGTYLTLRHARPTLFAVLLAGVAITIVAELSQGLVPNRVVQLSDIAIGFGGVLIAAIGIEIVLRTFEKAAALRIHTAVATIASVVLAVLLVFDLAPETLADARPDGINCPLTDLGSGRRIDIGANPTIQDGCLRTDAGGFGLFGPQGSKRLDEDSVLLSSPLSQFGDDILRARRMVVAIGFSTADFSEDPTSPGAMLSLRFDEAGELVQIRTRDASTQVIAPNMVQPYRSLSYSELLEPNTSYELVVELTDTDLLVFLDGELIATNRVDPAWLTALEEANDSADLTLYIGNTRGRVLPFSGVIEWVEIST